MSKHSPVLSPSLINALSESYQLYDNVDLNDAKPVLYTEGTVDSANGLYLCALAPDTNEPRAVCSGWADETVQTILREHNVRYAGSDILAAQRISLLEQSLCAVQTALVSEAMSLGLAAGVKGSRLYEAIAGSAGSSWSFREMVPQMLGKPSGKGQTLGEGLQATAEACRLANQNKTSAPLHALSKQLYHRALRTHDRNDSSSLLCDEAVIEKSAANGFHAPALGPKPNVGLIGLGAMGYGMANVLRSEYSVIGYDAWAPLMQRYVQAGGVCARSIEDCARTADVLVLMVVNASQAEDVLFKHGAAAALPRSAVVLLMCTVAPSQVVKIAQQLSAVRADVVLVDAPVSGGTPRAASGDLSIFSAGLDEAEPSAAAAGLAVLQALSGRLGNSDNLMVFTGGVGKGSTVKLINQHLAGSCIISVAETLAIASSLGLPLRLFREIILDGPASSWMMGHRGQNMLDRLLQPPTSMIDIFVKDMSIVNTEADMLGVPVPLAAHVEQTFISGQTRGWGRDDDSSIIRLWGEDIMAGA